MWLVLLAAAVSSALIIVRGLVYKTREITIDRKWWMLIGGSLAANVLAFFGFMELMKDAVYTGINYSSVLSVLALLSAGVIAGNFSFTYQEAAADERLLPNAIAIIFVNLFHLLWPIILPKTLIFTRTENCCGSFQR